MLKTIKFLLIATLAFLSACSNHSQINHTTSFTEKQIPNAWRNSYKSWLKLKDKHNAFYSYERDNVSSEGFHSSTKLTVINDQVEYRDFFEWQKGHTPTLTWSEEYAQLGLHNQGASVKTLDELYNQCKETILNKPPIDYLISFKVDQLNVLKQCSFTLKACNKNCTKGIRIQGLTLK